MKRFGESKWDAGAPAAKVQNTGLGMQAFGQAAPAQEPMAQPAAEMVMAVIQKSFEAEGYSTLSDDPEGGSGNTFLLDHGICPLEDLQHVTALAFEPCPSETGDLLVKQGTLWSLKGLVEPGQAVGWGQCMGVIERITPTGDAFVNCPEVKTQYGREAYIFNKVMQACCLSQGVQICFNIHVNPKGMPQVSAPMWVKHTPGMFKQFKGKGAKLPGLPKGAGKGKSAATITDEMLLNGDVSDDMLMQELAKLEALEKGGSTAGKGGQGVPHTAEGVNPEELTMAILLETKRNSGFSYFTSDPSDPSNKIFCHQSVISIDLAERCCAIAFKPHINSKGETQVSAPAWCLMGKADPDTVVKWGQFHGTISKVSDTGDGFVDCPEAAKVYAKEVYIFRKVMQVCQLSAGDEIVFDVHVSSRGDPQCSAPVWKKNTQWIPGYKKGGKGGGKEEMMAALMGKGGGKEEMMAALMGKGGGKEEMMAALMGKGSSKGGKDDWSSWGGDSWGGDSWGGDSWGGDGGWGKGGGKEEMMMAMGMMMMMGKAASKAKGKGWGW